MVLPDTVAEAASTANRRLGDLYGLLMRIDGGAAQPGENVEAAWQSLNELWDPLWDMRRVMRADLGITAPEPDR
ncbi:hypothetical protein ACIPX0_25415 [Streptomyces sp. NPDC090075]